MKARLPVEANKPDQIRTAILVYSRTGRQDNLRIELRGNEESCQSAQKTLLAGGVLREAIMVNGLQLPH